MKNLPTKHQNWRKLLPIAILILLTAFLHLTSCQPTTIEISPHPNQPAQEQPETPEPTPEISPTPTPTPISSASLSINQSGNTPGSNIGLGGAGFTPNETVIITFDDMEVARVFADADGLIMAVFQVPDKGPGVYMIKASDSVSAVEVPFTITVPPPSTPVSEE